MKRTIDPLSELLSPDAIRPIEQMSMPYLGYYLLRETLTRRLLGESEAPILYWTGKELGDQIVIDSAEDLVMTFIRLGLGKLEVLEQHQQLVRFGLQHSSYALIPVERLTQMLSLEAGLLAGAIGAWRDQPAQAGLEIHQRSGKKPEALITVRLQPME
ncbi:YslB family protein [Brevibacillus humidisoli]|uniref:DUF2507 domain-containing protein n=1 Tax=Brevibacillus humidisoli TaxID=2895522 RepID=UPI001E45DBC9|nr:DUF2507 domain-containing protein [Brevibacillus humidisoli]UFJ39119.1 YslB family protein [Brevibacillus humidisoli]